MAINPADNIPEENPLLLTCALIGAVIAISFAAIFIRLSDAPALIIAFYRLFLTLIILIPHALLTKWREIRALNLSDSRDMVLSGFFLAAHFYLWIASLDYAPVVIAVIMVSLHPLLVAVAGHFFLGDAIPRRFPAAMVLVFAGTAVIALDSMGSRISGDRAGILIGALMAFGGAVMISGYLLIGRKLRRHLSTPVYAGGTYLAAALTLLFIALVAGTPLGGYPTREYLLFAALALIPTIMGHTVFNWALKRVRASLISLLYLGEPLGATLLAFLILREAPSALQALGGAAILGGLYLVIREDSKP